MLNMLRPTPNGKAKPVDPHLLTEANVKDARRAAAWLQSRVDRAAAGEVFSEIVTLNPVLAELLLGRNLDNRSVSQLIVSRYAQDVRGDAWSLNGESIKVSADGFLNDGQHRCAAVIAAGKPIETIISFGFLRDTRTTLDQGRARTVGDYLKMDGVPDANHVAAAAGWLWQVQAHGRVVRAPEHRPTKVQTTETAIANPAIIESVRFIPNKGSVLAGGKSVLAFCHFMFAKRAREAADEFIVRLIRGDGLLVTDPIYYARERLRQAKRTYAGERIELIYRAWNAHRLGKRLNKVVLTGTLPRLER